ncbi:hypothetical protein QCA50_017795 [Cerrena zonata]|uniref:Secreted protein n=1 Tax=Cerrena zonata TaxID=2478898 RepID=A0AAW0FIP5_9APHY
MDDILLTFLHQLINTLLGLLWWPVRAPWRTRFHSLPNQHVHRYGLSTAHCLQSQSTRYCACAVIYCNDPYNIDLDLGTIVIRSL